MAENGTDNEVSERTNISNPEAKPLDTWDGEDVYGYMEKVFSKDIALKFKDEDIDGESLLRLIKKGDEDVIFIKMGLTTFGKVIKFKKNIEAMLPAHLKSRCVTPSSVHSAGSSKPSMSDLASYGKDMEMLYKAKRSQIQKAAISVWPGNQFPNFRLAENKSKLDQLAQSLKEECTIPEIKFGIDGIRQHIQSVFNERRRARKRDKIDYDLPDKRMSLSRNEHDEVKPPLPAMQVSGDNKGKNSDSMDFDNDSIGDNDFVPFENDNGGDTDILTGDYSSESDRESIASQSVLKMAKTAKKNVNKKTKKVSLHSSASKNAQEVSASDNSSESDLESSQPVLKKAKTATKNVTEKKKKEMSVHSSLSKPDHEVTAINLSSKSAKVLVLTYSGESAIENITKEYLYQIIKDLAGKVSLAKSLHLDALYKAVAVKLVNQGRVKIRAGASLSSLKRSDIICIKK